jgi:hypothetical protein
MVVLIAISVKWTRLSRQRPGAAIDRALHPRVRQFGLSYRGSGLDCHGDPCFPTLSCSRASRLVLPMAVIDPFVSRAFVVTATARSCSLRRAIRKLQRLRQTVSISIEFDPKRYTIARLSQLLPFGFC